MKILAFAGSNSSTSINYQLVKYTVSLIDDHEIQLYNMANMAFPMYSIDTEKKDGFKNSLVEFKTEFQAADKIIISVNEHNNGPSAYAKNLWDWLSRLDRKFAQNCEIFLMSTSPGRGGAQSSRKLTEEILTDFGASIQETFSLPSFNHNFDVNATTITDEDLKAEHHHKLKEFLGN